MKSENLEVVKGSEMFSATSVTKTPMTIRSRLF